MLEELDSMQFLKTTVYWALRFAAYSAWKGEKWGRAGRGRAGRARSQERSLACLARLFKSWGETLFQRKDLSIIQTSS